MGGSGLQQSYACCGNAYATGNTHGCGGGGVDFCKQTVWLRRGMCVWGGGVRGCARGRQQRTSNVTTPKHWAPALELSLLKPHY